ncbi:MAG: hypothetical protein IH823_04520 [Candidatus Dadabacteria bacterium]|nr:hypothetical protein [Candidatus Dadabacteria bacterium]
MNKLALLSSIIFAIGCSHNTSQVNSFCTYEGIELDTTNLAQLNENDIIAKWKLQSVIDLSDCSIYKNPLSDFFYIELEFKESKQIGGHTTNEFYGTYILENKEIQISISTITEINEQEWGRKFLNAANNTNFVFIEDTMLFIFFNQSSEVMVFTIN